MSYQKIYLQSITNKEDFWKNQAEQIDWFQPPTQILSKKKENFFEWFSDGITNMSYLCLDYHIKEGRGNQVALIYDSPVTNQIKKYTYADLLNLVSKFADALNKLGVVQGDTVIIYMPMVPEAVISMLACARIGAIHSVVFGGFAPHELALRINDANPKVIISASYGIEGTKQIDYKPLVDRAILEAVEKPLHKIYFQRENNYDQLDQINEHDFYSLIEQANGVEYIPIPSVHPLYILYTSGTTGTPKGIVRDTGGYATALKYTMKSIYNIEPGDVFWAASDVGWVVGHSYIVYGPLLHGCTTVLYEGKPIGTPDAGAFWRVIEQHRVKTLFTAPTAIRAIKKEDSEGQLKAQYDLTCLQSIFLAGERCDPATLAWLEFLMQIPIIDHWWQTESGWPMLAIPMGIKPMPVKPGSAGIPMCGYDIQIFDEEGIMKEKNSEGNVVIKLPLPPGCLPTLWNNDARYEKEYLSTYQGYYLTGDGGYFDEDGYCFIMGRIDDVINVSGHRLSTGEMEEIVAYHHAVAECAVVGIKDALRGQRPIAFVVLKDSAHESTPFIEQEIIELIREKIGAIAFLKNVYILKRLPKTRSGKILRKTIRSIVDNIPYSIPSTIDDVTVLDEIKQLF
ncbi:MAG: acetate--CoA ligase [Chitinophagaceae bacterium]|nr:acetate--CoA ligase [Chitinophagaceae bacterium]